MLENSKRRHNYDVRPRQSRRSTRTHARPGKFEDCIRGLTNWHDGSSLKRVRKARTRQPSNAPFVDSSDQNALPANVLPSCSPGNVGRRPGGCTAVELDVTVGRRLPAGSAARTSMSDPLSHPAQQQAMHQRLQPPHTMASSFSTVNTVTPPDTRGNDVLPLGLPCLRLLPGCSSRHSRRLTHLLCSTRRAFLRTAASE